jgi:hypothetical protein
MTASSSGELPDMKDHDAGTEPASSSESRPSARDIRRISYRGALRDVATVVGGVTCFGFAVALIAHPQSSASAVAILFATGTAYVGIAALNAQTRLEVVRDGRRRLAELRASSLPERAKHAARALQEAVTLVEDLRSELDARTALLEDIRRQVAEATERASDMEKLSHVDEETTRLLNKYFDEALKSRLAALERGARGREWFIGTVVALVIGVGVLLLSNYVLGF